MRKAKVKCEIGYLRGKIAAYNDILNYTLPIENDYKLLLIRNKIMQMRSEAITQAVNLEKTHCIGISSEVL